MIGTSTWLRAELLRGTHVTVGHTTIVSAERAFIRTDTLFELGVQLDVELSFRGSLAPARFHATVIEHKPESGPGEYAGIWVSLEPRSETDSIQLRDLLEIAPVPRTVKVILVEDSPLTRDAFQHIAAIRASVTSASHFVLDAYGDADSAWAQLKTGGYHLAVIDHFLPDATGAELVSRIRADEQLRTLPVIGISMGGSVAHEAMLAAGADVFLDKPVQPRQLLAALDRLPCLGDLEG